eukprot:scaffold7876_cov67-Phaeocystis_antarctica.AAC.22
MPAGGKRLAFPLAEGWLDWRVWFDGDELVRQERHLAAVAEKAEREAEQADRLLEHLAQPHVHAHAHAARLARYMHTHDDRVLSAADSAFLQKRRRWPSTPATVLDYLPGPEGCDWGVTDPTPLTTHRDRSCCRR